MTLPTSMFDLIAQYAVGGDRAALLRLWESQAKQLLEVEMKRGDPDQLDRSKTIEEITDYYRANLAYI